jgi:general secretion pathway protein I
VIARAARGFTLLEVMIGLALLGLGLVVLIKSTTGNIANARQSQMLGVVSDLARGKMNDIEERLLKEGFTETDQSDDGNFADEGWPDVEYAYKVEQVELPSYDQLQAMASGQGAGSAGSAGSAGKGSAGLGGSGSAGDEAPSGSFQDSTLGSVISLLGGGAGGGSGAADIDDQAGASFIQGYYQLVQEALKVSIRKVTLTVKFRVLGDDRELVTVAFFTDPAAMDRVIPSLPGAGGEDGQGSGATGGGTSGGGTSGAGTRSGSGAGSGATRGRGL